MYTIQTQYRTGLEITIVNQPLQDCFAQLQDEDKPKQIARIIGIKKICFNIGKCQSRITNKKSYALYHYWQYTITANKFQSENS